MSIRRKVVLGAVCVISLASCEKASAPPPESATAAAPTPPPAETAAPGTSATSPVVETTPTTGSPEPSPTAASAPVVPPAASAPGAPTAGAAPGGAAPASAHAGHPTKEHAEAPATPASAAAGAEGPTPDDACQTKNFHYTQVASACKSGGRKAAKAIMKGVVKKAKAAGTDLMCTSCHEDMKDFHLKPNAVGDLKNWL